VNHETVNNTQQSTPTKLKNDVVATVTNVVSRTDQDEKHALAVAMATAEAARATAQAAVEVARLTKPSNHAREHYAAVVIQTSFRGYLVSLHIRSICMFGMMAGLVELR
jgi:hypothetical protein